VDKIEQAYSELIKPAHDVEPDEELAELLTSDWLRKKTDRPRRLKEHRDYLKEYAPELATMRHGLVIDLGPGPGELLEFARELEHEVLGIDAATGRGGMGRAYLLASRIITDAKHLQVEYAGVLGVVRRWRVGEPQVRPDEAEPKMNEILTRGGTTALVNSRGSIEQIFSDYMEGRPHDEHHMASDMFWRISDKLTRNAMRDLFSWINHQLRPGGVFLCHLNGSTNTAEAETWLDRIAGNAGLMAVQVQPRLHKWMKPDVPVWDNPPNLT
jgi:SAM-dependent methyltransferase